MHFEDKTLTLRKTIEFGSLVQLGLMDDLATGSCSRPAMVQLNVHGDKVVIFVSASPIAGEGKWTVVVLCYRHMAI